MKNAMFEKGLMQDLCRYIEARSDQPLTLEQLAKQAHLSPAYLQRRFKSAIGVSPKEYAESCRLRKLKAGLREHPSVTAAVYDAGFASPSRVYGQADARLGMTPKQYRTFGKGVAISYATAETALGQVLMGATDRGLCFLQLGDHAEALVAQVKNEYPEATISPMDDAHKEQFTAWTSALANYLSGQTAMLDLPLDIRGTAFQLKIWKYLQTIPRGSTVSYTDVAEAVGHPGAVRAAANACAGNRVAIVIPCHRVIRGNGDLAGYRWGVSRKRRLLDLERTAKSR